MPTASPLLDSLPRHSLLRASDTEFASGEPQRRSLGGHHELVADEPRRRCCRVGWWWRGKDASHRQSDISQVDAELVGDTDTDRLSAGVARLLYNHIVKAAGTEESILNTITSSPRATSDSGGSSSSRSAVDSRWRSPGGGRVMTSADFEEVHFLPPQKCRSWFCSRCRHSCLSCCFRKDPEVSANNIFKLLQAVATMSECRKEVVVLSAIYVERLLDRNPELTLSATNWRPVLVAGLHLALKTWEDVHPWNAEVAAYLHRRAGVAYPARSLYTLESRFLSGLGYRVDVQGQVYASYYFSLQEGHDSQPSARTMSRSSPSSPNLTPHLGVPGWQEKRRSLTQSSASATSDSGSSANIPQGIGVPKAGMVRSATWGHAFTSQGSFAQDSTPTSPVQSSQASATRMRSTFSDGLQPSSSSSTCTTTDTSPGQDTYITARQLRRQLLLDPQNPYVGSLRHAPQAPPPSPMIRKPSGRRSRGG